ncbi:Fic family protein [Christensenellaceae bacterium OttesenSCG-928-M15]|nr:Fic family protein [Christensenellaceae bacterium OttesenSCG-928-M15]
MTETKVLLEDGITAGGKPIRDYYEATGHADAYKYMLAIARSDKPEITENTILKLHKLFYNGVDAERAGRYRDHRVFISGTDYVPPEAQDVPGQMEAYIEEMRGMAHEHPVILAAFQDQEFSQVRYV